MKNKKSLILSIALLGAVGTTGLTYMNGNAASTQSQPNKPKTTQNVNKSKITNKKSTLLTNQAKATSFKKNRTYQAKAVSNPLPSSYYGTWYGSKSYGYGKRGAYYNDPIKIHIGPNGVKTSNGSNSWSTSDITGPVTIDRGLLGGKSSGWYDANRNGDAASFKLTGNTMTFIEDVSNWNLHRVSNANNTDSTTQTSTPNQANSSNSVGNNNALTQPISNNTGSYNQQNGQQQNNNANTQSQQNNQLPQTSETKNAKDVALVGLSALASSVALMGVDSTKHRMLNRRLNYKI